MFNLININNNFSFLFNKKRKEKKELKILIDRFYQVFNDHGIPKTEIPKVIPEISLSLLEKDEELLSILTNEMIERYPFLQTTILCNY